MKAEIHWIPGSWPGRLGVLPRPRGGDWLEDDVRAWRAAGVDVVVSLLTPDEVSELQLEQEEARCRKEGMRFLSLPIPDRGLPSSRDAAVELAGALTHALESDEGVGVHCRQGIGRSALVVASVLVSSGEDPASAFRIIESARGRPVPDTTEQRDWVERFASDLSRARDRTQRSRAGERRASDASRIAGSASAGGGTAVRTGAAQGGDESPEGQVPEGSDRTWDDR